MEPTGSTPYTPIKTSEVSTPIIYAQPKDYTAISLTGSTEFDRMNQLLALWKNSSGEAQFNALPESKKIEIQNVFLNKAAELVKSYFSKTKALYEKAETETMAAALALRNAGLNNKADRLYAKLAELKTALNAMQETLKKTASLSGLGEIVIGTGALIVLILTAAGVIGLAYYLGTQKVSDEITAHRNALAECNAKLIEQNRL